MKSQQRQDAEAQGQTQPSETPLSKWSKTVETSPSMSCNVTLGNFSLRMLSARDSC